YRIPPTPRRHARRRLMPRSEAACPCVCLFGGTYPPNGRISIALYPLPVTTASRETINQKPTAAHSPTTSPMKKGRLAWYNRAPPMRRINTFPSQPTNRLVQIRHVGQEKSSRYPIGCRGHQLNRRVSTASKAVTVAPEKTWNP